MANYPEILDNFTPKVDDTNDVMAIDVNELQTAVEALEAKVGVDNSIVETTIEYKVAAKENSSNKVTSLSASSTDAQYPSAKLVYDQLALKTENPMADAGDIIYGGEDGSPTALSKGTDGQLLTLASGLPKWVDPSGSVPESGVAVSDGSDWGASLQVIDPDNINPKSTGYLEGGTGHSALSVFQALGAGANDGKFKINVDGVWYNDIWVACKEYTEDEDRINGPYNGGPTSANLALPTGMSFTAGGETVVIITGVWMAINWKGITNGVVYLRKGAIVGGGDLIGQSDIFSGSGSKVVPLQSPTELVSGEIYNIQITGNAEHGLEAYMSYFYKIQGIGLKELSSIDKLAPSIQLSIQKATGSTETVVYDTDHFVITSAKKGYESKILKLMPPSTGTDISGNGEIPYLDMADNATETLGLGEDYKLVRLDEEGKISEAILPQWILDLKP